MNQCMLCHRPAAEGSWTCTGCGDRMMREAREKLIDEVLNRGYCVPNAVGKCYDCGSTLVVSPLPHTCWPLGLEL